MQRVPKPASLLAFAVFAVLAAAALAGVAGAQGNGRLEAELQVAVRPGADGTIEFGLSQDGRRVLPELRFLTPGQAESRAGRWLRSSAVEVAFSGGDPVRTQQADAFVIVRPHADGRIEFGVQVGDRDSERLLPRRRYLDPAQQAQFAGQWLESTVVTASIDAPEPPAASDTDESAGAQEPESAETPSGGADDAAVSAEADETDEADESEEAEKPDDTDEADDGLYRIPDGSRAGVVAQRNVIGDPDAPVLIREVSDFL